MPATDLGSVDLDVAGRQLAVEYRRLDDLVPYACNARTHSNAQIAEIAGSIRAFGFTNPVLIAEDGTLIAGHGRVLAARKLGMETVPAIVLTGLSDTQRRALPKPPSFAAVFRPWHDAHSACQRLRSQNTVSLPSCGSTWSTTLAGRIRS